MTHILDFGGIAYEGFCPLSLSVSQYPSGVSQFKCGGPFCTFRWAAFYYTVAQVFWAGELGLVRLQLTLVRLVYKLCPFFLLKLWSHAHGKQNYYIKLVADKYNGTIIKAKHLLLGEMKLL